MTADAPLSRIARLIVSTSAVSPWMRDASAASRWPAQVVVDDDVMTRLAQGLGGVASDIAGAPSPERWSA